MNKKLIKKVAKVIGRKLAVHELNRVHAVNSITKNAEAETVMKAFTWVDTPQGVDFWLDIEGNRWPYNYTRGGKE